MNEWEKLLEKVSENLDHPASLQDVLLLIGIRESCHPGKQHLSPNDQYNLTRMAEETVLVPARYYQLIWVEDNGWPHYQPLNPLPRMTSEEKEALLQPWILQYVKKNRMF